MITPKTVLSLDNTNFEHKSGPRHGKRTRQAFDQHPRINFCTYTSIPSLAYFSTLYPQHAQLKSSNWGPREQVCDEVC